MKSMAGGLVSETGVDSSHVRQGFGCIREKQPELWEVYGHSLELAATNVGPWKGNDGDNGQNSA